MRWSTAWNACASLLRRTRRRPHRRRAQEPADLGTAFGMEACLALEAQSASPPRDTPRRRASDRRGAVSVVPSGFAP